MMFDMSHLISSALIGRSSIHDPRIKPSINSSDLHLHLAGGHGYLPNIPVPHGLLAYFYRTPLLWPNVVMWQVQGYFWLQKGILPVLWLFLQLLQV